ncbi:L-aspartate oxidase [Flavobacterium columnare]|uniref:FAD-binding protein n=1 Tax=Flavobacterium columnare TaxID=996 RepID=UPI0007F9D113|nr:FAD-binding protein [Flavobacterium columnare]ANO48441.1 L-aspartate oxidase [Flavobacterium columnare]
MSIFKTDFLILGSGVAGLSTAIKLAKALPNKKITVVTKDNKEESNTKVCTRRYSSCLGRKRHF